MAWLSFGRKQAECYHLEQNCNTQRRKEEEGEGVKESEAVCALFEDLGRRQALPDWSQVRVGRDDPEGPIDTVRPRPQVLAGVLTTNSRNLRGAGLLWLRVFQAS